MTTEEEKKCAEELYLKVKLELEDNKLDTLEKIGKDHDPEHAMQIYLDIQRSLYWKAKSPVLVEILTREVLHWISKTFGPDLDMLASPLMNNLGSFTLPWWSDSLDLTHEQKEYGFEVSYKLVELRKRYNAPPLKISGAQWLLASHYLYSLKDKNKALELYEEAMEPALVSKDKESTFMRACCLEGMARTKHLLESVGSSMTLFQDAVTEYKKIEDEYNLTEVKHFLLNHEIEEHDLHLIGL
ncbi:MAG: hypothetical protein INQ03_25650 [Candidatus Heimdallarchaeota archaeon]|nr:hypothetical protein [Candidatus Heimdallarchaeota archaeon]